MVEPVLFFSEGTYVYFQTIWDTLLIINTNNNNKIN